MGSLDWGEFGGYKTKEALKYEVCTMALYGAGASVGDHMHPDGEMDLQTYENIGYAYDYLHKIAPYCYGGERMADIGIWLSLDSETNEGISNILLENQIDYDLITDNNFSRFSVVILPDKAVLDEAALDAFRDYLNGGSKLVYASPVRRGKAEIIEDLMPVWDICVEVKLDREITSVFSIHDGQTLDFTHENGVLRVTLPELTCHDALVLKYKQ